jgi:hypothetical protein
MKVSRGIFFSVFLLATTLSRGAGPEEQPVTDEMVSAINRAIVDEIYANDAQGEYLNLGAPGKSASTHRVRYYVRPVLSNSVGMVIYKLMPVGEVIRRFSFMKNGEVFLFGQFDGGFPPTQSDYRTVYADDDKLCSLKAAWRREYFEVDETPTAAELAEAKRRDDAKDPLRH